MADDSTLLQQTKPVITNELRLHDYSESRMAIIFGNQIENLDKINAYLTLRFKATNTKSDFIINRHLLNFVCSGDESGAHPQLTFNDYKIWNETNDGPNSGLNADLLDGRHATEFKDRYGYHHFVHQVDKANTDAKKNWVKVATFTTRKIGTRTDLDYDDSGLPAYGGIFKYSGNGVHGVSTDDVVIPGGNLKAVSQALAAMDIREQFKLNTPKFLDEYDPDVFHTTNILTEGVYNGTLRGCVTLLKDKNPTTFDFHIGLYEDPLCTKDTKEDGGWTAVKKYFYVSLHDETLPFLTDDDVYTSPNDDDNLNKGYAEGYAVNKDTDDINKETKDANSVVQNGYTKNNPRYPNFPYYSWDYKYNYNRATKTYNNDVSDDVCSKPTQAMANLYFSKPDGKKAEMLRELKITYGNNYKLALETELARLKELGLAMALSDDDEDDPEEEYTNALNDFRKAEKSFGKKVDKGVSDAGTRTEHDIGNIKVEDVKADKYEGLVGGSKEKIPKANEMKRESVAKTGYKDVADSEKGPLKNGINIPNTPGNYKVPPATMQDVKPYNKTRRRQPFPTANVAGESDAYQTYIDIMRLYHVDTRVDTIDGVQVVTHLYELYMAIDEKMEIRIQPYMSNACLMYNFNKCIQTSDLPKTNHFIRPKSIYDSRYASVHHRHYDYERRIWELTLEADQIWKNFKNYLTIDQGIDNANKVLLTDSEGKVYAAEDNLVKHCEPTQEFTNKDGTKVSPRRTGGKVLITTRSESPEVDTIENVPPNTKTSCVAESVVTVDELSELSGIDYNIKDMFDKLWESLNYSIDSVLNTVGNISYDTWENIELIWEALKKASQALHDLAVMFANAINADYVEKTGDTMTGSLWIQYDGNTLKETPQKDSYGEDETFCGIKFFSEDTAKYKVHGGYLYGATEETSIGLGVQRDPKSDRPEDWALSIRQDSLKDGIACSFNGYQMTFVKGGRDSNGHSFTLDFADLYQKVYGSYPFPN